MGFQEDFQAALSKLVGSGSLPASGSGSTYRPMNLNPLPQTSASDINLMASFAPPVAPPTPAPAAQEPWWKETINGLENFGKNLIGIGDQPEFQPLANAGNAVVSGLGRVLRPVSDAAQFVEALGGDAANLYNNGVNGLFSKLGVPGFENAQQVPIQNPVTQMQQILADPSNRVAQNTIDDYWGVPQDKRSGNVQIGKGTIPGLLDPGSQADILGQTVLGFPAFDLLGEGAKAAGSMAMNAAGKIPAVAKAADALAASKAGATYDAEQAAKMADTDPFSTPAPDPAAAQAQTEEDILKKIGMTQNSMDQFANGFGISKDENAQHLLNKAELAKNNYNLKSLQDMYDTNYPAPKFDPKVEGAPKPRWANNDLNFGSDLDKALYIIGRPGAAQSASHAKFVNFARKYLPGMSDADIQSLANDVHSQVKGTVKGGSYDIPDLGIIKPVTMDITQDPLFTQLAGRNNELQNSIDAFEKRQAANKTAAQIHPNYQNMQGQMDALTKQLNDVRAASAAKAAAEDPATITAQQQVADAAKQGYVDNTVGSQAPGQKLGDLLGQKFNDSTGGQILQQLFSKYGGVTNKLVDQLQGSAGNTNYEHALIDNFTSALDKKYNLTPQEHANLADVIESGATPLNNKVQSAVDDFIKARDEGFAGPDGQQLNIGTNAETGTQLYDGTHVLDPKQVNPNYFPHHYNNSEKEIQKAFQLNPKKYSSIEGAFTKERKFDNLKQAQAAGLKPETNAWKVLNRRLKASSTAVNRTKLLNSIMSDPHIPLYSDFRRRMITKDLKTGKLPPDMAPVGYRQSRVSEMRGAHMPARDEEALWNHLNPNRGLPDNKAGRAFVQGWDKINDIPKHLMYSSPIPHMINVAYNGLVNGGADMEKATSYAYSLMKGKTPAMVARATKAGAVSADVERASSPVMEKIMKVLSLGTKDYSHKLLWNTDKAIRTSLFEKYVGEGMSDAKAAQATNKKMVDYNNVTSFEKNVLTRIFPFYRWQKGNMASQLTSLPKLAAFTNSKNAVNRAVDNKQTDPEGRFVGNTTPDNKINLTDLPTPGEDLQKLTEQGIPSYLYSHANPTLHLLSQIASGNKYYPSEVFAPPDRKSMGDLSPGTRIINPVAPASHNAASAASMLMHDYGSPLGTGALGSLNLMPMIDKAIGARTSDAPPFNLLNTLEQNFGLRPSQIDLRGQAIGRKAQAKEQKALLRSYQRQQGGK